MARVPIRVCRKADTETGPGAQGFYRGACVRQRRCGGCRAGRARPSPGEGQGAGRGPGHVQRKEAPARPLGRAERGPAPPSSGSACVGIPAARGRGPSLSAVRPGCDDVTVRRHNVTISQCCGVQRRSPGRHSSSAQSILKPLSLSEPPPPSPPGGVSGVQPHAFHSAGGGHELVTSGPLQAEQFPGPHPSLLSSVLEADCQLARHHLL